jgi:hypothetical protein
MSHLKTKESKETAPQPTCFRWDAGAARLGFTFELGGKHEIFAVHSFLSRIEMKGENEIAFHYTYGVVHVIGHHLKDIYQQAKQYTIGVIRPSDLDDPCRAEIEVTRIVFEDAKADI